MNENSGVDKQKLIELGEAMNNLRSDHIRMDDVGDECFKLIKRMEKTILAISHKKIGKLPNNYPTKQEITDTINRFEKTRKEYMESYHTCHGMGLHGLIRYKFFE